MVKLVEFLQITNESVISEEWVNIRSHPFFEGIPALRNPTYEQVLDMAAKVYYEIEEDKKRNFGVSTSYPWSNEEEVKGVINHELNEMLVWEGHRYQHEQVTTIKPYENWHRLGFTYFPDTDTVELTYYFGLSLAYPDARKALKPYIKESLLLEARNFYAGFMHSSGKIVGDESVVHVDVIATHYDKLGLTKEEANKDYDAYTNPIRYKLYQNGWVRFFISTHYQTPHYVELGVSSTPETLKSNARQILKFIKDYDVRWVTVDVVSGYDRYDYDANKFELPADNRKLINILTRS